MCACVCICSFVGMRVCVNVHVVRFGRSGSPQQGNALFLMAALSPCARPLTTLAWNPSLRAIPIALVLIILVTWDGVAPGKRLDCCMKPNPSWQGFSFQDLARLPTRGNGMDSEGYLCAGQILRRAGAQRHVWGIVGTDWRKRPCLEMMRAITAASGIARHGGVIHHGLFQGRTPPRVRGICLALRRSMRGPSAHSLSKSLPQPMRSNSSELRRSGIVPERGPSNCPGCLGPT